MNESGEPRYRFVKADEVHKMKSAGQLPQGTHFFEGACYLPYEPREGEIKSGGQRRVESLVGAMMYRVKKSKEKTVHAKARALCADASYIRVFPIDALSAKELLQEGKYLLEVPERRQNGSNTGVRGLVAVQIATVTPKARPSREADSHNKKKSGKPTDEKPRTPFSSIRFMDGTGSVDGLVGKSYGASGVHGHFDVTPALSVSQIMAKEENFSPPAMLTTDDGRRAFELFRRVMRAVIFNLLNKKREEEGALEKPAASESGASQGEGDVAEQSQATA